MSNRRNWRLGGNEETEMKELLELAWLCEKRAEQLEKAKAPLPDEIEIRRATIVILMELSELIRQLTSK